MRGVNGQSQRHASGEISQSEACATSQWEANCAQWMDEDEEEGGGDHANGSGQTISLVTERYWACSVRHPGGGKVTPSALALRVARFPHAIFTRGRGGAPPPGWSAASLFSSSSRLFVICGVPDWLMALAAGRRPREAEADGQRHPKSKC